MNVEKRQLLNKKRWGAKVTAQPLEVGDRVLVRNFSLRTKHVDRPMGAHCTYSDKAAG